MKCESYGISCNYASPELQTLFGSGVPMTCSTNETIMSMFNVQLQDRNPVTFNLKEADLELLNLFQTQTVLTIGTHDTVHLYKHEVIREAAFHPYLMHVVLALASMHKRDLYGLKVTADEEFHWYTGAALFREVLAKPIRNEDKDSLWATAALLGASSFYRIDATTPEEAWPLNPEKDLTWLALSDGKKAVWKIADVGRKESVFHDLLEEHQKGFAMDWTLMPPNFKEAGIAGMPYHAAASTVANLLVTECNHGSIVRFLAFISSVQPQYRQLLEAKDSRALLVLSYWYAKVCTYNQWWIRRRARLECQAICIYLERHHGNDIELMRLLHYPKMMCGIVNFDRGLADESGKPTTPNSVVSDMPEPLPDVGRWPPTQDPAKT